MTEPKKYHLKFIPDDDQNMQGLMPVQFCKSDQSFLTAKIDPNAEPDPIQLQFDSYGRAVILNDKLSPKGNLMGVAVNSGSLYFTFQFISKTYQYLSDVSVFDALKTNDNLQLSITTQLGEKYYLAIDKSTVCKDGYALVFVNEKVGSSDGQYVFGKFRLIDLSDDDDSGLSPGAIAGIIIGCVFFIGLCTWGFYRLFGERRGGKKAEQKPEAVEMAEMKTGAKEKKTTTSIDQDSCSHTKQLLLDAKKYNPTFKKMYTEYETNCKPVPLTVRRTKNRLINERCDGLEKMLDGDIKDVADYTIKNVEFSESCGTRKKKIKEFDDKLEIFTDKVLAAAPKKRGRLSQSA